MKRKAGDEPPRRQGRQGRSAKKATKQSARQRKTASLSSPLACFPWRSWRLGGSFSSSALRVPAVNNSSIPQSEQLAQRLQQGLAAGVRLLAQGADRVVQDLVAVLAERLVDRLAVGLAELAVEPAQQVADDRLALGVEVARQAVDDRAVA